MAVIVIIFSGGRIYATHLLVSVHKTHLKFSRRAGKVAGVLVDGAGRGGGGGGGEEEGVVERRGGCNWQYLSNFTINLTEPRRRAERRGWGVAIKHRVVSRGAATPCT